MKYYVRVQDYISIYLNIKCILNIRIERQGGLDDEAVSVTQ